MPGAGGIDWGPNFKGMQGLKHWAKKPYIWPFVVGRFVVVVAHDAHTTLPSPLLCDVRLQFALFLQW
jgi:hypothetical protein